MSANFKDIKTIWEYSQLIDLAKNNKPYRNASKDSPRYPLGNRRYSDRYFKPRLDSNNKDIDFDRWFFHHGSLYDRPPIEIYYSDRYMLGTFHSDNTFEFNPSWGSYSQGDNGVVSAVLPGWISSKVSYGGLVFYHRQTRVEVPVHEGMRIRLCDGAPTEPYEMHVTTLDRKKTRPYRQKYDAMFKTALVMLNGMGVEGVLNELHEMHKGQVAPAFNYKHELLERSHDADDPAGAVLWLALRYNTFDCRYKLGMANTNYWSWHNFVNQMEPPSLVRSVKNYLYKEVYGQAIERKEDILKSKVYRYGDKLPTVEWGHKMFVNGVERKRLV